MVEIEEASKDHPLETILKEDEANKDPDDDLQYHLCLRAPINCVIAPDPTAFVHSREWKKIMNGDPVEINPSEGHGLKIMTVDEWTKRWKRNEDFPDCLACGSKSTKEHHFFQTWCRGKKKWESELICMDCHMFSFRSYCDPDFMTPEDYEKVKWESMVKGTPLKNSLVDIPTEG